MTTTTSERANERARKHLGNYVAFRVKPSRRRRSGERGWIALRLVESEDRVCRSVGRQSLCPLSRWCWIVSRACIHTCTRAYAHSQCTHRSAGAAEKRGTRRPTARSGKVGFCVGLPTERTRTNKRTKRTKVQRTQRITTKEPPRAPLACMTPIRAVPARWLLAPGFWLLAEANALVGRLVGGLATAAAAVAAAAGICLSMSASACHRGSRWGQRNHCVSSRTRSCRKELNR